MKNKELIPKLRQYADLQDECDVLSSDKEWLERKLKETEEEFLKKHCEESPKLKKSTRYERPELDQEKIRKTWKKVIISTGIALLFFLGFLFLKDLFFLYGVIAGGVTAFVFFKSIQGLKTKHAEQVTLYEEQEKKNAVFETEFKEKYAVWEQSIEEGKAAYKKERQKFKRELKATSEKLTKTEQQRFALDVELDIPFLIQFHAYELNDICGFLEENPAFSFEKAKAVYEKHKAEVEKRFQEEMAEWEEEQEREKEERARQREQDRLLKEQERHNKEMERLAKLQAEEIRRAEFEKRQAEEKARWEAHKEREQARKVCSRCAHLLKCRKKGTPNCPTFTPDKR